MKVGTKSVLFGAHQFLIHPVFVAIAWWKLYGFPFDPRLWIAFFIHDLGYVGKPYMDGIEGEKHPEWGAGIMFYFGGKWFDFCLYHSRFYARQAGQRYSRLCVADKLGTSMEPWWLYLPRVIMSGEIDEYIAQATGKYSDAGIIVTGRRAWFDQVSKYMKNWAYAHKDLKEEDE